MKAELESTSKIVEFNGIPCRIWEGKTAGGVPFHAYICRVGVSNTAKHEEFERELIETKPPSPEIAAIPMRMIL